MRNKFYTVDVQMSLAEIRRRAARIKLFDGSERVVIGGMCVHRHNNFVKPLAHYYPVIKNVKDERGVIIAKRFNISSPLLFTSNGVKPVKNKKVIANTFVNSVNERHAKKLLREQNLERKRKSYNSRRPGECREVSIAMKDTGYNDQFALKKDLIAMGAERVSFYSSFQGLMVVVDPLSALDGLLRK